jgi:hypothetical protein
VHEPTAPELQTDEAMLGLFDKGTQVCETARAYVHNVRPTTALRAKPPRWAPRTSPVREVQYE